MHLLEAAEGNGKGEGDVRVIDFWWEGRGRVGREEEWEGGVEVCEGKGELGLPEGVGEGSGRLRGIVWVRSWIRTG